MNKPIVKTEDPDVGLIKRLNQIRQEQRAERAAQNEVHGK